MHFLRSRICKLAIIGGALLGFSNPSNAQDITTGLLAHWKMDEISGSTIIDHSGNSHHGTWVDNSDNNVSDNVSAGIDGGALIFDGTNAYISIDPLIVQNAAGTMSAWVKTSKRGAQMLIFTGRSDEDGCSSAGIKPGIELSICEDEPTVVVERGGQTAQNTGSADISDNKWHHVVGTWDSVAGEIKIYIDGVEENSTALNFTPDTSRNVGYIGRPGSVTDRNFGGSMDDVRIYDRALSGADVTALYQTGFPCENPNGRTGQLIYNSDHNTPQYCNGTKWISAGKKAPPLSGLVGHWKLDETSGATIADSSGNDYDGAWTDGDNNDVTEETAAGKAGASITFDGADDVINLGDVLDLPDEITICAWAKPENNTTGYIFGKYDANTFNGVFLRANTTGAWTIGTDNVNYLRVDNTIDFGVWQHVCGVISPSPGTSTLYKNGAALISNTTTPAHIDNARSATIGGRYDGDDIRDFEGQIDDVRVYNRALSSSEIAGIYGVQDTNCNAVINGMVGHWKLNETSGSVIFDSSGNGNSGTWTDGANNDVAEETIAGQAATALTFDGTDNIITVPHSASLDISTGYTVSGWVYFDSAATGTITPGLISKNTTGGWGSGWVIGRTSAGGNIVGGKVRMGAFHNRDRTSFSNWNFPVDTWNYITVTWDGNTVKYYLNANLVASDDVTDIPDTSSGDLRIGNGTSLWYNNKHHGNIDDLRLYNYALTQTEITSLYGTYASVTCTISTCDSPFSAEGAITYNTTSNAMQFCNGYEWMAMGADGAGGGGCSSPSGTAGSLTYNTTSNVMQYCDGSAWHSIGQTGSNIDSTNGLVTHYKLDETTGTTVTDSSGNSYHGTMEGDLDADTDSVAGVDGAALRFAGTNVTKIVGDTQDNMSEFTTCLWFNLDSLSNADGDAEVELINKGGWHLFIDEVATTPHLRFSIATDDIYPVVRGSTTIAAGQWYHACAIYNGVGTIPRVYLNGVNDSTGGTGGTGTQQDDSARIVRIGAVSLNEYYANFPGIMDDVRIYNRELNQSEITALYEIGTPPSDITSNLAAHWQLDETSGTTASDSAASNDGTMTNMDGASNTVSGPVSTALSFSSSRITAAAASSDIDDIFDGGGTISYWIYPTNWGTFGRVIDKSDTGTFPPNQGWHSQGNTGIIKFSHAFSTAHGDWETGANTVPMNTWSHIMITYNSSSDAYTPIIYINGVNTPVSTINSPTGTAVSDASQPITLGARQGGGNSYTGYIDDVRMYTRTLSSTDATALYNTGTP